MRLARATAGHVPAHARTARASVVVRGPRTRRASDAPRSRRWLPVLIIAAIYLVAIAVNEWRLHQHVQELRERPPVEIVDLPPAEPAAFAEVG